ncbi:MAG: prepilin-type N-terminal cleavage/methylation domain-containing protein [Candidatus Omnitrophota bacterium]
MFDNHKPVNRGFSLIEMMITIAIFLIISSAIFLTLATGRTYWYTGNTKLSVQQEARRAMEYMVGELRQSRSSQISGVPSDGQYYNSIAFRVPQDRTDPPDNDLATAGDLEWSDPITYSLVQVEGISRIERTPSKITGKRQFIGNYVSGLTFRRDNFVPNVLEIEVIAQKQNAQNVTVSTKVQTNVKLRN